MLPRPEIVRHAPADSAAGCGLPIVDQLLSRRCSVLSRPEDLWGMRWKVRTYDEAQLFFLTRMYRMAELARRRRTAVDEDWKAQLLRRAIYSTLCDCLELEVGGEALRLLRRRPSTISR